MNEFPAPLDPESEAAYAHEHPEWDEDDEAMTDEELDDLYPEWSGRMTTHIRTSDEGRDRG